MLIATFSRLTFAKSLSVAEMVFITCPAFLKLESILNAHSTAIAVPLAGSASASLI